LKTVYDVQILNRVKGKELLFDVDSSNVQEQNLFAINKVKFNTVSKIAKTSFVE